MQKQTQLSQLIVLGCGSSDGVPRVTCLTKKTQTDYCKVCHEANPFNKSQKLGNDERSKNFRRTISLLLKITNSNSKDQTKSPFYHIVIDVGKFFYASAMEWFPQYDITHLDSIILSHNHADACFGIDDLRDWSKHLGQDGTMIPVYMHKKDEHKITEQFPYFESSVQEAKEKGGGGVPALEKRELIDGKPIEIVPNFYIQAFIVNHGQVDSLGFSFEGPNHEKIVWCSDVKFVPEKSLSFFENLDMLFLDLVYDLNHKQHSSHFNYDDSITFIRKHKPKQTYFVGMNHTVDYRTMNEKLKKEFEHDQNIKAELAYDGLVVQF
ncbi:unnamed protein product [Didymodactylos carnosus]|uniref:Metallo-beta-lactamase domain-containing protein n=1 Tax=Didymodactylos carnosus TaxID=1234261 RepID=A0A814MW86_9BILA|nr:unnamed protein product [Didymodactylos carnosus]CAF1084953.1 unnamed protein product [Didymodactylos carnosus]CAF3740570.1 unnamed protein product [Didymodactylos carnosus]CAF3850574.1 unnamed protein product [Didymodactylos carnosus]